MIIPSHLIQNWHITNFLRLQLCDTIITMWLMSRGAQTLHHLPCITVTGRALYYSNFRTFNSFSWLFVAFAPFSLTVNLWDESKSTFLTFNFFTCTSRKVQKFLYNLLMYLSVSKIKAFKYLVIVSIMQRMWQKSNGSWYWIIINLDSTQKSSDFIWKVAMYRQRLRWTETLTKSDLVKCTLYSSAPIFTGVQVQSYGWT